MRFAARYNCGGGSFHLVRPLVGAKGEEDYGLVRQSLTKAVLTLPNFTTFLAYDKNSAEVAVNAGAAAASEVQPLTYGPQTLSIVVGITKDLLKPTL